MKRIAVFISVDVILLTIDRKLALSQTSGNTANHSVVAHAVVSKVLNVGCAQNQVDALAVFAWNRDFL